MIVPDGEAIGGERAKILDFGIAKGKEAGDPSEPSFVKTQTGALMGTPRYMSPEQCRGLGEISGKSDVYSLGVMLYEMVSGRPPMVAEAAGELIAMHLYMTPPPLRELDPTLPGDLTQLIESMLAKNPDDRPVMTEVVRQLEEIAAHRSIPPPLSRPGSTAAGSAEKSIPPSTSWPEGFSGMLATPNTLRAAATQAPARPPAPRRSAVVVAAAGVAAMGLLSVVFLSWNRRPAAGPRSAATATAALVPPQPAAGPPAAATKVRWRVTSQPAGAQVVRMSDGAVLGTTPWESEQDRGAQRVELRLKLQGYVDQSLELSQSADAERSEQLRRAPAAALEPPHPRGKRRGPLPRPATSKSSSEDLSDDELRIVK
jgi:serine/threonine-protein kinase